MAYCRDETSQDAKGSGHGVRRSGEVLVAPVEPSTSARSSETLGPFLEPRTPKLLHWRTALWKLWKRAGQEAVKRQHKDVDREIKRKARQLQRTGFNEFVAKLNDMPSNQAMGVLSKMLKAKKKRRMEQSPAVQNIIPAEFTVYVASQHSRRSGERRLQGRQFEVDSEWRAELAMKASGIRRPRMSSERLRQVYGALIRPVWTYAIHLSPYSLRV